MNTDAGQMIMLECLPLLCSVLGDVEFTGCRRIASIRYDNAKFVLLKVTYRLMLV